MADDGPGSEASEAPPLDVELEGDDDDGAIVHAPAGLLPLPSLPGPVPAAMNLPAAPVKAIRGSGASAPDATPLKATEEEDTTAAASAAAEGLADGVRAIQIKPRDEADKEEWVRMITDAVKETRNRAFTIKFEQKLSAFIEDASKESQQCGSIDSSFHRLLVHRVAELCEITHPIELFPDGKFIVLGKTPSTKPCTWLQEILAATAAEAAEVEEGLKPKSFKIMQRGKKKQPYAQQHPGSEGGGRSGVGGGKQSHRQQYDTLEEREAAYAAARARIFQGDDIPDEIPVIPAAANAANQRFQPVARPRMPMYQYGQNAMTPGMMGPGGHHHQPNGWRPRGAPQQYIPGQTQQYRPQWSQGGHPYMMPGMHPGGPRGMQSPYTRPQMMQNGHGSAPSMAGALNATPKANQDGMAQPAVAAAAQGNGHGRQPQQQPHHQSHHQHPQGPGQRPPLFGTHPDFNPTGQPYGGPYNPLPDIYGNPMMQPVMMQGSAGYAPVPMMMNRHGHMPRGETVRGPRQQRALYNPNGRPGKK